MPDFFILLLRERSQDLFPSPLLVLVLFCRVIGLVDCRHSRKDGSNFLFSLSLVRVPTEPHNLSAKDFFFLFFILGLTNGIFPQPKIVFIPEMHFKDPKTVIHSP